MQNREEQIKREALNEPAAILDGADIIWRIIDEEKKKALEFDPDYKWDNWDDVEVALKVGFEDGAKWADENSNWVKTAGDEKLNLPEKANGTPYNVILKDSDEVLQGRFFGNSWIVEGHDYSLEDVIYWIELPKAPKMN